MTLTSSISRQREQPLKNRLFIIARNRGKILTPNSINKIFQWSVKKKCCVGPAQSVKQNSDTDCAVLKEQQFLIKIFKNFSSHKEKKIKFIYSKNVFKSTN